MSHRPSPEPNLHASSAAQVPMDAILVIGGYILVIVLVFLSILILNDGKFTYTLDDPYIHLAVAEEIAVGHYGVNHADFSSPCSSPIWPFLLAPLARTGFGEYFPLFLNFVFGLCTSLIVLRGMRRVFTAPNGGDTTNSLILARVVAAFVILAGCNVWGLVFSGMEHSLQVLVAVMVVDGIVVFVKSGRVGPVFLLAMALGPLVRYENLALTAAACLVLALNQRLRLAAASGSAAVVGLAGFSGFLVSLGLPAVPSSVAAKSYLAGGGNLLGRMFSNLRNGFELDRGVLLLLMVAALIGFALRPGARAARSSAVGLAVAGVLHALFGAYGWYHRYECYIFAAMLYGICMLLGEALVRTTGRWSNSSSAALALFGLVISFPYLSSLLTIPVAANNIYEQQFQMHRFVTGWWKKPVAVNDLGWVAFRNDDYVLDLWGLGSHAALKERMEGGDPRWMRTMAEKHAVDLIMVYENWVPARAVGWIKVGELHLSRKRITPADSMVSFFATSEPAAVEIDKALVDFRKTLPTGVSIRTRSDRSNGRVPKGK